MRNRLLTCVLALSLPMVAGAQTPGPAGQPASVPTPTRLKAELTVRSGEGVDKRLAADTRDKAKGAEALCLYSTKEPADTLAFAVAVPKTWEVKAQIKGAKKKPIVEGVVVTAADGKKSSVTQWTGGEDACRVTSGNFDGKKGTMTVACTGLGSGLGEGRSMEMKVSVEGCPSPDTMKK